MGILKNIEWVDNSKNTLVYKIDMKKDYIAKGSALTVRESQAAIFCDKGRMADVFLPGFYKLSTDNVPLLTKLMSWKYGFESPFKSDVYFVNTRQFTNEKWGTVNPIIIRDADYGAVRVRGYGTYSFRVDDPYVFMTELAGTGSTFKSNEITDYLRSMVITGISDIIGQSKIPVLDMAGNLLEFGKIVEEQLDESFKQIGLKLSKFNFENFSMPEALEKALDESASLGILGKNMGTYMQKAQADALKDAAKNPGMAGASMGAGMGMGMGIGMGNMFGNMFNANGQNNQQENANSNLQKAEKISCVKCGANMKENAKFCPECGNPAGVQCPNCKHVLKAGSKFCPECGTSMSSKCPSCNADLKAGAKFCPECGEKI